MRLTRHSLSTDHLHFSYIPILYIITTCTRRTSTSSELAHSDGLYTSHHTVSFAPVPRAATRGALKLNRFSAHAPGLHTRGPSEISPREGRQRVKRLVVPREVRLGRAHRLPRVFDGVEISSGADSEELRGLRCIARVGEGVHQSGLCVRRLWLLAARAAGGDGCCGDGGGGGSGGGGSGGGGGGGG